MAVTLLQIEDLTTAPAIDDSYITIVGETLQDEVWKTDIGAMALKIVETERDATLNNVKAQVVRDILHQDDVIKFDETYNYGAPVLMSPWAGTAKISSSSFFFPGVENALNFDFILFDVIDIQSPEFENNPFALLPGVNVLAFKIPQLSANIAGAYTTYAFNLDVGVSDFFIHAPLQVSSYRAAIGLRLYYGASAPITYVGDLGVREMWGNVNRTDTLGLSLSVLYHHPNIDQRQYWIVAVAASNKAPILGNDRRYLIDSTFFSGAKIT